MRKLNISSSAPKKVLVSTPTTGAESEFSGFVFWSDDSTFDECLANNCFGAPLAEKASVLQITSKTALFLYNNSTKTLYGSYTCIAMGFPLNHRAFNSRFKCQVLLLTPASAPIR